MPYTSRTMRGQHESKITIQPKNTARHSSRPGPHGFIFGLSSPVSPASFSLEPGSRSSPQSRDWLSRTLQFGSFDPQFRVLPAIRSFLRFLSFRDSALRDVPDPLPAGLNPRRNGRYRLKKYREGEAEMEAPQNEIPPSKCRSFPQTGRPISCQQD